MPGLDTIKAIIEALRGGSNPQQAYANEMSTRSSMNPTGHPYLASAPAPAPSQGGYGMSKGLNDPEYLSYVKSSQSPKPYMKWVEEGE
jgi:hypothetical protein